MASYWDYVKAAFHLKVPVAGLGALPLNKLLLAGFGILGIAHPGFWLLGLAFETAYLTYLPGSPRFQKVMDGLLLLQAKQPSQDKRELLFSSLNEENRTRFTALTDACRNVLNIGESSTALNIEELKSGELNELSWVFLKLLVSKQHIEELLAATDKERLRGDIEALGKRLAAEQEGTPLVRSLKNTLEIQQRRLDNLQTARESLRVADAELERIEKQVSLLVEETALGRSPEALSSRLNGVMESLQGTSKWMSENTEFFTSLDESAPPDLMKVKE